jgi:hypothetical protein
MSTLIKSTLERLIFDDLKDIGGPKLHAYAISFLKFEIK